jgi:hypothetical protein
MLIHQTTRRLAVLTGLCLALTLVTAATVAAYPVMPDGEPVHLYQARSPSVAAASPSSSRAAQATQPSPTREQVSPTIVASSGISSGSVIAVAAGLAAIALIAGSFALTNHRRRPAGTH